MMKMNKNVLLPDLEHAYDEFAELQCMECTVMDSTAYCNALVYTRVELASLVKIKTLEKKAVKMWRSF
jgi:hypothetical protein